MERKTVRRFLRADSFPERKPPRKAPPKVEQYAEYLQQRWNEGVTTPQLCFGSYALEVTKETAAWWLVM
jgi:hypothetical protein